MKEPLVSVIIPTYNRKAFVQDAIDSVLNQTYPNVELIVIDDGSTDGTGALIEGKYQGKLRYVWQENQERSAARNHGLSLANGKYVAFLDSDDYWEKDKLSTMVPILEDLNNKQVVAVCSSVWLVDINNSNLNKTPVGRSKNISNYSLDKFFEGPKVYASPSNLLMRSKVVKKLGGFDTSISYGEDWDLMIRLRSQGGFVYIDKPLLNYRVNPDGTQGITDSDMVKKYLDDRLYTIHKNAPLLKDGKKIINAIEKLLFEDTALRYFAAGCLKEGFDYLEKLQAVKQERLLLKKVNQKICYWVAAGALEKYKKPHPAEDYFVCDFLDNYLLSFKKKFQTKLNKQNVMACFYHQLAFLIKDKQLRKHYLIKAIRHNAIILFKPSIIKFLFMYHLRQV